MKVLQLIQISSNKSIAQAVDAECILVSLDSNHTHEHAIAELNAYADLVSVGSYCIVFDTVIEDLPAGSFPDRPWDVGDNPFTAMQQFMNTTNDFVVDELCSAKAQITEAFSGYLKRVN